MLPTLRASLPAAVPRQPAATSSSLTGEPVTIVSIPPADENGATLVVASNRPDFPTAADRSILQIAANICGDALARARSQMDARRLAGLVDASSSFIGLASVEGVPIFINPAGLKLVGLTCTDDLLGLHVIDLLAAEERDRALHEVWPTVLARGRWSGALALHNRRTGLATPLLVESLRIDGPDGEPLGVGTISVDIGSWIRAERTANDPPALERTLQVMQAAARIESLSVRERQVLHALVAGRSHKMIAHELGLSVRTIEAHRARMMRRLDVRSFADAVKLAILSGQVA